MERRPMSERWGRQLMGDIGEKRKTVEREREERERGEERKKTIWESHIQSHR